MPRRCSVYGCKSNYKFEKGIRSTTVFALPKSEPLRSIWLKKIPTDFSAVKNPFICIHHFHESQIIRVDRVVYKGEVKEYERTIPKLIDDAVPCIFTNVPTSSQPNTETLNSQNNNLPQRPVRSKSLAKETRVDEVIPVVQFKELKSHLSSRNVNRMLELHKYILQIASMCYQLDFKGFAAAHIFDNMIKASFFTSEETETKTCVPLDQVGHVCECFIVNEHGKIGCGLYRVLVDILGEDIVYHLGLHSRPFSEVMMTFVNAAGFTILGQANLQLLMNIFSDVMSN